MGKSTSTKNNPYSVVCPNAQEKPGEGLPRIAAYLPNGQVTEMPPGVTTLHQNFLRGLKASENGPCLGHREKLANGNFGPYVWQSYQTVLDRAKYLGSSLSDYVQPKECVGIYSINRPEWMITEQACFIYNFTTVPLYDTLGKEALEFIITQTEMKLVVTTQDKLKDLLSILTRLPSLKTIVVMDTFSKEFAKQAEAAQVQLLALEEMEKFGLSNTKSPLATPTSDDLATICYTSGTTGIPKGVMLTHRNILSVAHSLTVGGEYKKFITLGKNDIHISYLPLAHVFERAISQVLIFSGAQIGFYQGDTLKLLQDVAELRPTIFVSVPRLFNRIYDKVWAGVREKGGLAACLFQTAFNTKKANLKKGIATHWLWDKLVFANVRAKLGGRIRLLFTGSAPISEDVVDFLRICFSCDMYEGYGQTETTAGIAVSFSGDTTSGQLGAPLSCNQVKLVDVPSMNYTSKDTPYPRGEIYVKGASIFVGYYKAPELTKETLKEDGWCATGDVGLWDDQGRLRIIDRVKHIFKLSQGEYIAPEKIESVYAQHELVQQCFVYGHSLKSCLVGLVVLDPETMKSSNLKRHEDQFELKLGQLLATFGKKAGLKGFEILKAIHIIDEPFSLENGLLTPTFKYKRHEIKLKYEAQLDALYKNLE